MAAETGAASAHATLSGTTVDTVTLTQGFGAVEVIERGGTLPLWITYGATTPADPVAAADDTTYVPPGAVVTIDANSRGGFIVKILGNGNAYSVQGVDA
jgi:hypothetical protein